MTGKIIKKVYIIHGWEERGDSLRWYKELRDGLDKKRIVVKSFDMPDSVSPKIEKWVEFLEKNIDEEMIDEHTWFVGHSIGCQTIMRYLEKLHKNKKIAGCAFVAPWFDLINLEPEENLIAHPWINSDIHFERILEHTDNFLCIFSDDDPNVHLNEIDKFKEKLGAKILIKKGKGHFEEVDKIPEILDFVK